MSHTPGPWYVGRYGENDSDVCAESGPLICAVRGGAAEPGDTAADADAHLISAAPDLLHACQAIANDCERILDGDDFSGMSDADLFRAFLDTLSPVIAKAEGTDGQDRSMD